jgi:hypothetical protein
MVPMPKIYQKWRVQENRHNPEDANCDSSAAAGSIRHGSEYPGFRAASGGFSLVTDLLLHVENSGIFGHFVMKKTQDRPFRTPFSF